ncbi:MAG: glycoside hydrolase family 3 N-terminal domain-containing protein [Acidimicrobiia bacterium]
MTEAYLDTSLPVEERVDDLLRRMTLDEKLAQIGSRYVFELLVDDSLSPERSAALLGDGVGHISRIGGASALDPGSVARVANEIQRFLKEETRLGIPALVHEECIAGYMGPGGTNFPHAIGVAASWDPTVPEAMGRAIARQVREAGAHQGLAPVLDVCRDPRWGRVEETSGEDPYLVAAQGIGYIRGLQHDDPVTSVVATAKHFAGHGIPEGGMNSAPPHIGPRELREVFLTPFEAAVRVGDIASFMHAYHEIDGVPCIANKALLSDLLRDDWGFNGTMVSDYNGVEELEATHKMVPTQLEAAVTALECGVDVELPSTAAYGKPLKEAVLSGRIDESVVDRSVARVLTQKFSLGLFENPYVPGDGLAETESDKAVALDAARRSLVLLKNDSDVLPVDAATRTVAVVGPSADDARLMLGDYSYAAALDLLQEIGGAGHEFVPSLDGPIPPVDLSAIPTVLDAVRDRAPAPTVISHARGCDIATDDRSGIDSAVAVAGAADVVVFVAGGRSGMDDPSTTGEFRDRTDIGLPGVQQELLDAVVDTGTPVVLVILSGRPLSPDTDGVAGVIHAWLPGDHGGRAIAEAVFGDFSPGGKLPITVPQTVGQVPIYHGHKPTGGKSRLKGAYVDASNVPKYPFGFGLSYTEFSVAAPYASAASVGTDGLVTISTKVTNVGTVAGDEVVQLYARRTSASLTRPVRELVGFARVSLAPGEERTIWFEVPADVMGFVDVNMDFSVEPGPVVFSVGTSALDISGSTAVDLTGDRIVEPVRSFFSAVSIE